MPDLPAETTEWTVTQATVHVAQEGTGAAANDQILLELRPATDGGKPDPATVLMQYIIDESGLNVVSASDMKDGAQKIVELAG